MLLPGRYIRRNHDSSKALETPSCTRLLLGARAQSSTDAKDKIFAFHGILGLLDIQLPAPDYSKPVSQIYREAAAASIFHDSSLMLLSSLTGESFVTGLPSWVPDWSNKDVINEAALWSEARATNLSSPIFEISQDQSLLTLRGKTLLIRCRSIIRNILFFEAWQANKRRDLLENGKLMCCTNGSRRLALGRTWPISFPGSHATRGPEHTMLLA
jgi:hypothetical protein